MTHAELRKRPPTAVSSYFTVRPALDKRGEVFQVAVPVRVEPQATKRNRIRRQVTNAARIVLKKHSINSPIAITVRRRDIPQGAALQQAIFELLQESGMIQQ